ncbi:MAG: OmpH family outer membrane protein [Rikenellaceae bacterium]|jgi:outer membrane protein|nr:OmpH family outer membrane protein [Rikenellaceae bacterium]
MKKFMIFAVAALALAGCKNNATKTENAAADSLAQVEAVYDIAYVDMDVLITGYDMYNEKKAELDKKAEEVDRNLTTRGRKLEKEIMDFQEKINNGLVTRSQAAEMEANLNKKGQAYEEDRQRIIGELQEEQTVMLNNVSFAITNFIKGYNAEGRYKMILANSASGPVLDADPAMDITQVILAGLNAQYAEQKAAEAKENK